MRRTDTEAEAEKRAVRSDDITSTPSLLPGLPDDIATLCLARVPSLSLLWKVSPSWQSLISTSTFFHSLRSSLGFNPHNWFYALIHNEKGGSNHPSSPSSPSSSSPSPSSPSSWSSPHHHHHHHHHGHLPKQAFLLFQERTENTTSKCREKHWVEPSLVSYRELFRLILILGIIVCVCVCV